MLNNKITSIPVVSKATPDQAREKLAVSFKDMLHKVNEAQIKSDIETEKLITGKTDNLHNVMITAEKASITLNTAVEVRNKAIEAYQEIMRMQV
ncbi:flagellar hook-basal body complex protein FliE [Pseudalkalibacillus salsuginis]|uniref:flagellar hook-basal body complex protein FliE n=1 Tax=Pseudalkalibacillus salsuginis TaxID=2910972 RepID=UPI001F36E2A0|nr:flagellar hook-basal body complex protein FliE [Pseudalkalibacillus salsuginis]MCF6410563.1 flagellar hook-basal body complex protein FliE [Pseudalkalibacillus salsuginis]